MRKRGFGVLFVLTLVIGAGTIVQDFRFDTLLQHSRDAAIQTDRQLSDAFTTLADLRTAQAGYVATGQGPAFWMDQATALFNQLDTTLSTLRSSAVGTATAQHYDAAISALKDLKGIDARARTDVTAARTYEASDRLFTDTREATERLTAEIGAARAAQLSEAQATLARISRLRLGMNGVAMAFVLAVAMFYWRARVPATSAAPIEDAGALTAAGSLRLTPVVVPPAAPAPQVNLKGAAELCIDLARVIDSRDVPGLLERAAAVLGAKGIILWMTDSGGALLRPSIAHGYSDRVITKMGALQVDADNATSLAFRSLRSQTVNGAGATSPGAIAVPLITSTGCVGVLAAEVHWQKPTADIVDLARIIAAQLAVLVVPSAEASQAAQG